MERVEGSSLFQIILAKTKCSQYFLKSSLLISFIKALNFETAQKMTDTSRILTHIYIFGLRRSLSSIYLIKALSILTLVIVLSFLIYCFSFCKKQIKTATRLRVRIKEIAFGGFVLYMLNVLYFNVINTCYNLSITI